MEPKRLVIIDGYSLLYRAFFATRFLSTADGRPTNALHGFTNMLFLLLDNVKPDAIVVALDSPGKTFRHVEYAEYKGTRRETADELKSQFPVARDLIAALGIPSIEVTGFEADDVVGTISRLGEENGYNTIIVTGDLDALQLVDPCVSVLTMKQGVTDTVTYTPEGVVERYGFGPEHIPDYKAIVGDTSDNIIGVPGIGAKGAADLIQKFGTIENMVENFDKIDPKYRKKIDGNQEQMLKSKWLATIDRKVPLTYDFKPFVLNSEQLAKLQEMFEWLEFRALARRVPIVMGRYLEGMDKEQAPKEVVNEQLEVKVEQSPDYASLAAFVNDLPFAIFFSSPIGRDLFDETERRAYVAVNADVREAQESDAVRLLLEKPKQAILHDAKPFYRRLQKQIDPPLFDTMLGGYVLQSGRSAYALRDLVQGYLEIQPPNKAEEMAAALFLLRGALSDRLDKEGQAKVLDEVEIPLIPILARMEQCGISVSREMLREFSQTLESAIERTATTIYELAGQTFTIGSPKQLGEILFDKLQIPGNQKTKTGYATGAEVLQLLAAEYPICAEVMNWRELSKLKSTYADSLDKLIQADGRIHTTYNQTVAATGRLSSVDPNLQNIPIRTELGRSIRQAFVAAEGYSLLSLDYSQIELRILAHMCGDEALVEAFERREDVHTVTAQKVFNLGDESPSKEQRRLAKMLNYAVLYGVTGFGLAQQLGGGFSVAEAKALIDHYFERFPSVKGYTTSIINEARSKGFTTTLIGRRRYFPEIHAAKIMERQYAERQAINAPIQGTASDMIKLAMINVARRLEGRKTRLLLNVHDELVFELAQGDEDLIEPIRTDMETAMPLSVPVEVDAKVGKNWNEMTPIER